MTTTGHTITESSTAPVWLLDFDDVVNACPKDHTKSPDRSVWKDWVSTSAMCPPEGETEPREYPIWYSETVVGTVAEAHAAGVEVVWLSTWERHTAGLPAAIPGLPALPYLARPDMGPDASVIKDKVGLPTWKFLAARLNVPSHRSLLWTDDDLRYTAMPASWAANRAATGLAAEWARLRPSPTLLIAPTVRLGFTPKKLRAAREFLDLP